MLEICTTVSTKRQAQRIARLLVAARLAACVSFNPVFSIYHWKNKIKNAQEWALRVKTSEKLGKKCEAKLRKLHSYEMPVITIEKMKVDKRVEQWVAK